MTSSAEALKPCIFVDIHTPKEKKRHGRNLTAVTQNTLPKAHSADSLRSREEINQLLRQLISHRSYHKAALLTFGINTGFRAGDILSLRVCDVIEEDNKVKDFIVLQEDKTDKLRTVWFNEAVKISLQTLIEYKGLKPSNYLFRPDGNKKSFVKSIVYDEDGNVTETQTCFEPYDEDGQLREVAPMTVGSVCRWLKGICAELGISGKYSSHAMRQTYAYHLSHGWSDNGYAQAVCADFGHSSVRITLEHYMGISPNELRRHQLELNLGLEAWT